jgi:hypothetical protein
MKVGNVEVEASGTQVKLTVHGCSGNYRLIFVQNVGDDYDALLRAKDIYQALRLGRIAMQNEVLDNLARRKLPGAQRGKLRRAIDAVRSVYGL